MRKIRLLQGAVALAIATCGPMAFAADHLDSASVKKDAATDITDVYGWVEGAKTLLVLNVSPLATMESKFSDAVQYALHLESSAAYGMSGEKMDVICTFDTAQKISCWVGDKDYVTGDASATSGLTSASGKTKVFAGLRKDPFYFNLAGFNDATGLVADAAASLTFDGSGCPAVDVTTSGVIVGMLQGTNMGAGAAVNFFEDVNVLSIVLEVDTALVNGGGPILAVWGSTHKGG